MCQFFSVVSDGKGKAYYFNAAIRRKTIKHELPYESTDSHTSIADYFGFKGAKEDTLNKYEYNPLTKVFQIDRLNTTDDSKRIKAMCNKLDFKTIVPELVLKPIINPFKIAPPKRITKKHIGLLKKWASVRDSVWDSVGASVRDSVWASVRDSVWASVGDSVWASAWDSVGDSVWDSVWASVGAYISSFFNLPKWQGIKHKKGISPFQSCIDLWEMGLVPSFDGKVWRLHGGPKAEILWEGKL